jgi:hypothetical protein
VLAEGNFRVRRGLEVSLAKLFAPLLWLASSIGQGVKPRGRGEQTSIALLRRLQTLARSAGKIRRGQVL